MPNSPGRRRSKRAKNSPEGNQDTKTMSDQEAINNEEVKAEAKPTKPKPKRRGRGKGKKKKKENAVPLYEIGNPLSFKKLMAEALNLSLVSYRPFLSEKDMKEKKMKEISDKGKLSSIIRFVRATLKETCKALYPADWELLMFAAVQKIVSDGKKWTDLTTQLEEIVPIKNKNKKLKKASVCSDEVYTAIFKSKKGTKEQRILRALASHLDQKSTFRARMKEMFPNENKPIPARTFAIANKDFEKMVSGEVLDPEKRKKKRKRQAGEDDGRPKKPRYKWKPEYEEYVHALMDEDPSQKLPRRYVAEKLHAKFPERNDLPSLNAVSTKMTNIVNKRNSQRVRLDEKVVKRLQDLVEEDPNLKPSKLIKDLKVVFPEIDFSDSTFQKKIKSKLLSVKKRLNGETDDQTEQQDGFSDEYSEMDQEQSGNRKSRYKWKPEYEEYVETLMREAPNQKIPRRLVADKLATKFPRRGDLPTLNAISTKMTNIANKNAESFGEYEELDQQVTARYKWKPEYEEFIQALVEEAPNHKIPRKDVLEKLGIAFPQANDLPTLNAISTKMTNIANKLAKYDE